MHNSLKLAGTIRHQISERKLSLEELAAKMQHQLARINLAMPKDSKLDFTDSQKMFIYDNSAGVIQVGDLAGRYWRIANAEGIIESRLREDVNAVISEYNEFLSICEPVLARHSAELIQQTAVLDNYIKLIGD